MQPKASILVVDDDPTHLRIYGWILNAAGFCPTTAQVLANDVCLPEEDNFDVVVLDYRLTGTLTAVEAARAAVLADAGLMRVALENILRNAWKYTSNRADAKIEFGFRRNGPEFVCFIQDNGAGFNPEFADRLFKPFQRLHTQSEFSGTGIGLATVERILARHGGRVWAESSPERGATFYFALDT